MLEKLGLGTVQFGQAYGVSNPRGQVPKEEAAVILHRAAKAGIRLLDTAANYGEAESVLAELDTSSFRVVTKTINLGHGLDQVIARARRSAQALKADTLLVHAASDLKGAEGEALWGALRGLKDEGVFRRIGISAYVADDPAALAERFLPDAMQLPFSLLDQRLLTDGTLARLNALGVEVHARSLFLQGLLFLEELPPKLRHAASHLARVRKTLAKADITPLAAALGFVLAQPEIAFGLVGVTSSKELNEIIAAAKQPLPSMDWASFALKDELVLTPSLW
ncbi:MAG TPA: aldo/keto reductase [Rhizomicrobium sp.]|jgi:aryl-alcohol dehydrogenase-like predicted oxidoreductase|nr:aldo/keto reductase [Rhizomicrobium sp.]